MSIYVVFTDNHSSNTSVIGYFENEFDAQLYVENENKNKQNIWSDNHFYEEVELLKNKGGE